MTSMDTNVIGVRTADRIPINRLVAGPAVRTLELEGLQAMVVAGVGWPWLTRVRIAHPLASPSAARATG